MKEFSSRRMAPERPLREPRTEIDEVARVSRRREVSVRVEVGE